MTTQNSDSQTTTEVYSMLTAVNAKEDMLKQNEQNFLKENGLLETLDTFEYFSRRKQTDKIKTVQQDIKTLQAKIEEIDQVTAKIEYNLASDWHKLWTRTEKLEQEKESINTLAQTKKEFQTAQENLNAEAKTIEQEQNYLGQFFSTINGYIALTSEGSKRLRQLETRKDKQQTYEEFKTEFDAMETKIDSRYKKFEGALDALDAHRYARKDSNVAMFAAAISTLPGNITDTVKIADELDDKLAEAFKEWKYDTKDSDRLRPLLMILSNNKDTESKIDELVELYKIAMNNKQSNSWSTFSEMAQVAKIPGTNPQEKWDRYDAVATALGERQWRKGSAASCYIAANLARKSGDAVEIAENFRNLEKALVAGGRSDCVESGVAALILTDAPGSMEEKSASLNKAFDALVKFGWNQKTEFYGPAAIMSLMPGNPEEKVYWLDEVTEKLKREGFRDVTNIAMPLVTSGYRDIFAQDPTFSSSGITSSDYISSDSSMFSFSGAILGDILDNGSLDFSSGFLGGGIIGAMLND